MYYNSGAGAPGQQMQQQGGMPQQQMMMPPPQQQHNYGGQMGGVPSPMGGPVMGPGGGMHQMQGGPSPVGGPMGAMGAPPPMQPLGGAPPGDHQQAAPDQMRQQPTGGPAGPMPGPSDDHQQQQHVDNSGHSNVYVRNIPEDVTEPALEALFRVYGDVNSCRLVRGTKTNPRGYGFVRFASYNEAVLAINSLNGYQAGPAQLEVKFADADAGPKAPVTPPSSLTPRNNLYVRNLPSNWGEEDVRNFFLPYGEVVELRLLNNTEHANRSVAALVRMGTIPQATAAIEAQNGKVVQGAVQPVMLRYADSAGDKAKRTHRGDRRGDRYAPYPAPGGSGSGQSGEGLGGMWNSSGFGGFNADMSADMGMQGMGGMSSAPQRMDSGVVLGGMGSGGMLGSMDSGGYGGNQQQQAQTIPTAVFIKNLPADTDKLYLYEKFAPYGAISSVKVLKHENTGQCTGIGFVNFCHHASALDAVSVMNGLKVADKQLIVNIQTPRKGGGGSGYHQGSGFH